VRLVEVQTLDLHLSDTMILISEAGKGQIPFTVTWLLRSTKDLSTNNVAMCLSSTVRERDFTMASQGHTFIDPPSEPVHISPVHLKIKLKFINY
jgi:hypothetical protein